MIPLTALLLALSLFSSMQELLQHYRMQLKGEALYEERSYSKAEDVFRELISLLPEQEERVAARFNLACALYMQGKYPEASTLFAHLKNNPDKVREPAMRSLFNEGNALAMTALGSKEKQRKTVLFRYSLDRFKSVLINNPGDGDAKINYEIVRRYLHELETPEHAPSSSGSGKKGDGQPESAISKSVANRLLEKTQQDESSMMQQLPRAGRSSTEGHKNNRDW
ncbi:MAG: tetratricopeptide repeat protein [Chlorobium sp.]|nr:MAG: tetratricopeptide repeat protein [Chlorobium sp.]